MSRGVLVVLLAVVVTTASAARILAVFPMPSRSHRQFYSPLLQELASRGHHVTLLSPFEEENNASNVTVVKVVFENLDRHWSATNMTNSNTIKRMLLMFTILSTITDMTLTSPDVAKVIHSNDQNFDLVIIMQGVNDALLALGRRFNAPVITVCPTIGIPWAEEMLGNELNPSYVPNTFLSYSDHMTFFERFVNFLFSWGSKLMYKFYLAPAQDTVMRKHFRGVDLPPLLDLYSDVAVNFVNIVPGINYPRPLTPGNVPVGGLHILPTRPLPQDLKKFLDEATEGAILFSLGSNVRSADFSKEIQKNILRAFSKLNQRVIWKFETDNLEGLPSNVKIWKWLPQNDILAHRNVKAFVTHGGLLSSQEAMYHGVPVVAIPFFGDQQLNAEQAQRTGVGVVLQQSDLSEETLYTSLIEILHNPRYSERAALMSRIFRDQPQSALERAVFWVEYVLRHKGAPHLRCAAADLTWYQRCLLDVVAVLVLAAAVLVYCGFVLCRKLFCAPSRRRTVTDQKKKN